MIENAMYIFKNFTIYLQIFFQGNKPRIERVCERDACTIKILNESIESNKTILRKDFYWASEAWTTCSTTCGNGIQKRIVQCYRHSKALGDEYCRHLPKKETTERSCKLKTCAYWAVGPWEDCQATCGEKLVQRRLITCEMVDEEEKISETLECDKENRPEIERNCGLKPCEFSKPITQKEANKYGIWIMKKWSEVFLKIFL